MPFPLQQANVGVVPDDHVEISVRADLLEKAHMPAVKPVKASRHHYLLPSRRSRRRRRFRKTAQRRRRKHVISQSLRPAPLRPGFILLPFDVGPQHRLEPGRVRQSIWIHRSLQRDHALDIPDRSQEVEPFRQWKLRRAAGLFLDGAVRPDQHGHRPQPRSLLQKTDVPRTDIVKGSRYNNVRPVHSVRTWTCSEPGTFSREATIRYPPPQPENIAPG